MKRWLTIVGIVLGSILVLASLLVFINSQINLVKEKKVMVGFDSLLEKENLTAAELIRYIDGNINNVSQGNAAVLVRRLEVVQRANLPQWEKQFENEAFQRELARVYQENGWRLNSYEGIRDNELKAFLDEAVSNGYKLETAEGFFFPVIDYTLYERYYSVVTRDMSAYFEIMTIESEQTPVKDAALMIEWEEILERALRQEEFIKNYGASTQAEAVEELLKRYVTFSLFGCNNTPLFSYETKEIVPEARKAYLGHSWNEKQGSFSTLMKEYLKVLKANDYRLAKEVDEYRKDAVSSF